MTFGTHVRLAWLESSAFSATQANPSTGVYTATISGADQTLLFPVGSIFTSSAGGGGKAVSAVAYTGGDTIITTANSLTPGAATVTQTYNWLDLTWSRPKPTFNTPGVRSQDRHQLVHRIVPADSTAKKRFCIALSLPILDQDVLATCANGSPLPTALRARCLALDTEIILFHQEDQRDALAVAYQALRAYKLKLDDVPGDLFGGLSLLDSESLGIILNFTCHSDGTFTTFNNIASGSYVTRPT